MMIIVELPRDYFLFVFYNRFILYTSFLCFNKIVIEYSCKGGNVTVGQKLLR